MKNNTHLPEESTFFLPQKQHASVDRNSETRMNVEFPFKYIQRSLCGTRPWPLIGDEPEKCVAPIAIKALFFVPSGRVPIIEFPK